MYSVPVISFCVRILKIDGNFKGKIKLRIKDYKFKVFDFNTYLKYYQNYEMYYVMCKSLWLNILKVHELRLLTQRVTTPTLCC